MSSDKKRKEESVKKYRTLAKAIIANDVQASKDILEVMKEKDKELTEDEINALGLRWFMSNDRKKEMILFLDDLKFNFSQLIIVDPKTENVGSKIPFRLIGDDEDEKLLKELINLNIVDKNITDGMANSLLVESLDKERFDISKELLNLGLDINKTNIMGQTALHVLSSRLKFQAVKWLCENNIDPTIEDLQGARASEMVPDNENEWDTDSMYEVLEDYVESYTANKKFEPSEAFIEMVNKEYNESHPNEDEEDITVGEQANNAKKILNQAKSGI